MVNTLAVSSKKCFHLNRVTKLERWLKEDQHQKDLIVEQPLLLVDEIKVEKNCVAKTSKTQKKIIFKFSKIISSKSKNIVKDNGEYLGIFPF